MSEQTTFIDPTEHLDLLTRENAELRAENEKLTAIYHCAEQMACLIGMDGERSFNTDSPEYMDLMETFFAFDGGSRKPTITQPSKE